MKILKDFNIPFSSLKLGSNIFKFEIEKTFFEAFNYTRYDDCNIKLHLDFKKENMLMDLKFTYVGKIFISCDRCLENVAVEFNSNFSNVLKFSHSAEETTSDGVTYLPYESYDYNVAQVFYEHVVLKTPKKILHQENQCDPKQIELMNLFSKSGKETQYDSRWNKLKDLKNK